MTDHVKVLREIAQSLSPHCNGPCDACDETTKRWTEALEAGAEALERGAWLAKLVDHCEAFVIAWASNQAFWDSEYGLKYPTEHGWHPQHETFYAELKAALKETE